jgi:hypothetical protein
MKRNSILILSALFLLLKANAQTTSPAPYCAADFDDMQGSPVADAIHKVSFGMLTNSSNAQFAAPHYVFYNNLAVPNFLKGNTYTLTVVFDVHGAAGYGVWIDYNQNNLFEAAEKVAGSAGTAFLTLSPNTSVSQNIAIPASALPGSTRMRIRIVEDDGYTGANGASIMACNTSTAAADVMDWGETEDYTINITQSTVGLSEWGNAPTFTLYPNPVSNRLTLNKTAFDSLGYQVSDLSGQIIQTGTLNALEKHITVSALPDGVYFLQLLGSNEAFGLQKFIKTSGEGY